MWKLLLWPHDGNLRGKHISLSLSLSLSFSFYIYIHMFIYICIYIYLIYDILMHELEHGLWSAVVPKTHVLFLAGILSASFGKPCHLHTTGKQEFGGLHYSRFRFGFFKKHVCLNKMSFHHNKMLHPQLYLLNYWVMRKVLVAE